MNGHCCPCTACRRDALAGQALAAIIAADTENTNAIDEVTRWSVEYADAMLAALDA